MQSLQHITGSRCMMSSLLLAGIKGKSESNGHGLLLGCECFTAKILGCKTTIYLKTLETQTDCNR